MLYPVTVLSAPPTGSVDFLPSSPYSVFEGHRHIIVLWIILEGSLFCYHSKCHVLPRPFILTFYAAYILTQEMMIKQEHIKPFLMCAGPYIIVITEKKEPIRCDNLHPAHYSSLTAPNFQPTATQEPEDACDNQHYSRELLMMGMLSL